MPFLFQSSLLQAQAARKYHFHATRLKKVGQTAKKKGRPDTITPYFQVRHELSVHNSLIMRGTDHPLIPISLRARVVDLAHGVHQGIAHTKQRLREPY